MKKYLVIIFKLVKAFLFFVFFSIAVNQLKVNFGGHTHFMSNYSDILVESAFFAVAWTFITIKFNKKRQKTEDNPAKQESTISQ